MHKTKYIIVTGGVLSGLGKGVSTAAIARLLKDHNKIITIKCDGYLNVDPGTMNPIEHGEVFVLHDGGEVDMDFGHYERFLGIDCKSKWNLTSGKIFSRVISKEREGKYLGKTIQIYPHIVDEIKEWLRELVEEEKPDIMMIEIGGTVGDDESPWFIEAVKQWKYEVGPENVMYIHLTYVPFLASVGELKTKPAQRDIALLRAKGINPDVVICRGEYELTDKLRKKLSMFCGLDENQIISGKDMKSIYEIPLSYKKQGLDSQLQKRLGVKITDNLAEWEKLVNNITSPKNNITIAVCGKYTELHDSYASIIEALTHAGAHCETKVTLKWIETTEIENKTLSVSDALKGVDGVLVPGGFGLRGTEGKISIIQYARENNLPYLGICYGLQLAVVEFARHVCNLVDANSTESEKETKHPIIDFLPEQREITEKGGTMRLGACRNVLKSGTVVHDLYKADEAWERHRHRYEVNPEYHEILLKHGLVFSATSEDGRLVECIELPKHPYFVATQAHNELTSRLEVPNPLFFGFVRAMVQRKDLKTGAMSCE